MSRRYPNARVCEVDGCIRTARNGTYCTTHYRRIQEFGSPLADQPIRAYRTAPAAPGMKWCSYCEQELPLEEFVPKRNTPDGLYRWCRNCTSKRSVENLYGITWKQFEEILEAQGGVCAICKQPETVLTRSGKPRRMSVDHDHRCCPGVKSCGKCIRAILCAHCNATLGMMNDDPGTALAIAAYLNYWQSEK